MAVSPTVLRYKGYRFFFFSREEPRMHVHVASPDGEAKFWLEPLVALAVWSGFSFAELGELQQVVEEHRDEFIRRWRHHFGG